MRIVMTADPEIPVPPVHYGGIERIVDLLVRGLSARGHEVHLFAHPDSRAPARLVPHRGGRSGSLADTVANAAGIWRHVRRLGHVDVVHSFARLAYLLPLLPSAIPKIQSYQRHVSRRSVALGRRLAGRSLTLAACSRFCAGTAGMPEVPWVVVPNGAPAAAYRFRDRVSPDAPLVFLGRLEHVKGAHVAIDVARRAGRRLIVAGNRVDAGDGARYFDEEIAPRCDGRHATYIGPVDDEQKSALLGEAAALLFPVQWDEPFGIAMVEALACGTPVVALGRGAVPEVVEHAVTGFVCDGAGEMVEAVGRIAAIDRARCRSAYERCFSDRVVVDRYEALYEAVARRPGAAQALA